MIIKRLCRIIISGLLAFAVLNGIGFFYSNVPPHYVNQSGTTDFCRPPHSFYSRWSEGGSFGVTNNEGLYNLFDYREGMPVDVIIMGSSHTEGTYVPMKCSIASLLNQRFTDKTVYNLGMASHEFLNCAENMEAALKKYRPEYVCILTNYLTFDEGKVRQSLKGELPDVTSFSSGVINVIERIPYARLLYDNWEVTFQESLNRRSLLRMTKGAAAEPVTKVPRNESTLKEKQDLAEKLFVRYAEILKKYNAKLIVFYDPSTSVMEDGSLSLSGTQTSTEYFTYLCDKNGFLFIDMSERYISEYNSKHILPHGFWNSSVGSGHLNRDGNAMIADEIYKKIMEVD